ncbi:hypothetical protein JCM8547_004489 [Rhodosporidiobolus lusitaniae]
MPGLLEFDNTSLALASLVVLALVAHYQLRPAPPHIHPFLLGRQSTPAPTRYQNESPVYRSSGQVPISGAYRPSPAVKTLADALAGSNSVFEGGERGTWIRGGDQVVELVAALRAGLLSKFAGLEGKVLVAVQDPTDALLVTLALATSPLKPVVLAPGSTLPSGLDVVASVQSTDGSLSEQSLPSGTKTVLLGEEHKEEAYEILATGRSQAVEAASAQPSDVALIIVSDGTALDLTHQNLTTSIVSWLSLFPASPQATRPTIKDFIVSFHHPSTPYGLGLALLAIYQSSSLSLLSLPAEPPAEADTLLEMLKTRSSPPANLIFAPTAILAQPLYTLILQQMLGDAGGIVKHARNGKLRLLRTGTVSKQTIWDALLFKGIRKDINLTSLRALFLSGPLEQSRGETFRAALGCSVVSTLEHPFLLAPLSTAHMWDVQRLPPPGTKQINGREMGHVGALTVGLEIKFKGEESEFEAGRVRGEILLRTPLLPLPSSLPSALLATDESLPPLPNYPHKPAASTEAGKWLKTGVRAEMSTEGTLWIEERGLK